jgi:flagellar motor switch protein FliG
MADTALALPGPTPVPRAGADKAAILLLTLGAEAATSIFRHLDAEEVQALSAAISRLRSIPKEEAAAVHEEAWRWLTNREGFLVDGEQFARTLTGGGPRAALPRPARSDDLGASLQGVAPAALAQLLGTEHPQVTAFVLANLEPKQAAQVLAALPEDVGPELLLRIADLQGVSEQLLSEVGQVLQGQVEGLGRAASRPAEAGGRKRAAEIMNQIDKEMGARLFTQLETEAPEVADEIRNLMFTFEDLIALDNRGMQVLLKEIPREDLILALKTASPGMRDKIFGNISQRAAEILQEDMGSMGPVRLKDVEKAQGNIVAIARRLQDEQKITIAGSGDDALI